MTRDESPVCDIARRQSGIGPDDALRPRLEAEVHPRRRRSRQGILYPCPRGCRALRPARPATSTPARSPSPHAASKAWCATTAACGSSSAARWHQQPRSTRIDPKERSGAEAGGGTSRRHAADRTPTRRRKKRWSCCRGWWRRATSRMKVAVPCDEHRNPVPDNALFHEKTGIIEDRVGDRIAWTGSLNETAAGWRRNWETINVFKSWGPERDRVDEEERNFDEPLGESSEQGDRNRRSRGGAPRSAALHARRRHAGAATESRPVSDQNRWTGRRTPKAWYWSRSPDAYHRRSTGEASCGPSSPMRRGSRGAERSSVRRRRRSPPEPHQVRAFDEALRAMAESKLKYIADDGRARQDDSGRDAAAPGMALRASETHPHHG